MEKPKQTNEVKPGNKPKTLKTATTEDLALEAVRLAMTIKTEDNTLNLILIEIRNRKNRHNNVEKELDKDA